MAQEADEVAGQTARIVAWVEENVGQVVECRRHARWRGGWLIDVRRDAEPIKLYVREARKEGFPPWPLEHEAAVLQLLEKHDVPVPHVYGICEDPHAIVMEQVEGEVDFRKMQSEEERISVLHDFAAAMAKMHAIDPAELAALGIAAAPKDDVENVLPPIYAVAQRTYRQGKTRPDPRLEFLLGWVRRNIPRGRNRSAILAVDSGQFIWKDGKVAALIDLEYGCIGDPMIDVGFAPQRGLAEHMGDMRPFLQRYRELTDEDFDADLFLFHAIWWNIVTPLIITPALNDPPPEANYIDYIGWYLSTVFLSLEHLAYAKGLAVADISSVDPARFGAGTPPRWSPLFDVMEGRTPAPDADAAYSDIEQGSFVRLACRLSLSASAEREYCAGVEKLTGKPAPDWLTADTVLEEFVMTAGPEFDDAIIVLLHAWSVQQFETLLFDFVYSPFKMDRMQSFSQLLA